MTRFFSIQSLGRKYFDAHVGCCLHVFLGVSYVSFVVIPTFSAANRAFTVVVVTLTQNKFMHTRIVLPIKVWALEPRLYVSHSLRNEPICYDYRPFFVSIN